MLKNVKLQTRLLALGIVMTMIPLLVVAVVMVVQNRRMVTVAQEGSTDVEDGFAFLAVIPELLGSFDPVVDFLDQGFDQAGRYGKPFTTITRVVHPQLVIGKIGPCSGEDGARVVLLGILWWRP